MIKWFPMGGGKNWGVFVCLDYPEFKVVFCLFVYEFVQGPNLT